MLFTRYVLLGRLADGSRVFWDTQEDRAVKRPMLMETELRPYRRAGATVLAIGVLLLVWRLLGERIGAVLERMNPDAFNGLYVGFWNWLALHTRPQGMSMDMWGAVMVVVLGTIITCSCYLPFCRIVFGYDEEYLPASPQEVAFAMAQPASRERYRFGRSWLSAFLMLSTWCVTVFLFSVAFLEQIPGWAHSPLMNAIIWILLLMMISWGPLMLIFALASQRKGWRS